MPAFVVFTKENTRDQGALDLYSPKAGSSFKGHPVTVLAAYGKTERLEGPGLEGAVILPFPGMAAAKAWYESPAYQDAARHRFHGADYGVSSSRASDRAPGRGHPQEDGSAYQALRRCRSGRPDDVACAARTMPCASIPFSL